MSEMSLEETNKDLVRRNIAEMNRGNIWGLGGEESWPEETRQGHRQFFDAFQDYQYNIDNIIAEGEWVMLRGRVQATHVKDWGGMKASGKQVEWYEASGYRIVDGSLVDYWIMVDDLGRMSALGYEIVPTALSS